MHAHPCLPSKVVDKGRMKFCRPVYRAIYGVDQELARTTFRQNQDFYHPVSVLYFRGKKAWLADWTDHQIARNMIAKDLKVETS